MTNNILKRLNAFEIDNGGSIILIPQNVTKKIKDYAQNQGINFESAVMEVVAPCCVAPPPSR